VNLIHLEVDPTKENGFDYYKIRNHPESDKNNTTVCENVCQSVTTKKNNRLTI
jgi:hypothetical protein